MRNVAVCIFLLLMSAAVMSAQPDRRFVRSGNRDFRKGDFKSAEIEYMKAVAKDSTSTAANYNLANTLYRQGNFEQAGKKYEALKETVSAPSQAAAVYYNSGNAASESKDWQAAVEAYRQSLLLNPGDLDAKENYIYAKEMLKNGGDNGQQGQDDKDQNQEDQNQDQNEDNQDGNDNYKEKDNPENNDDGQDNRQNDGNDNSRDGEDSQGRQPKITPQAAQQMLQAIQAKEKETQEKVKKEKAELLKSRQKEKNW